MYMYIYIYIALSLSLSIYIDIYIYVYVQGPVVIWGYVGGCRRIERDTERERDTYIHYVKSYRGLQGAYGHLIGFKVLEANDGV